MFKITKTTTNFNGEEITRDYFFNLTEAEIVNMQFGKSGGLYDYLATIINAKEQTSIIDTINKIVLEAYGEKSPDGEYFLKNDEIKEKFKATQAFSDIYMELAFDDEKAAEFINGILPDKEKFRAKLQLMADKAKSKADDN